MSDQENRRVTVKRQNDEPAQDPLQKAMGHFGRWQAFVCFVIFLLNFPVAWHQLSTIFIAPPASFTCANESIADKCSHECFEHKFDRSTFTETIIMQWDLVCDRAQLAKLSQMIFMFGIMVGNFIFGTMADKLGRRIPLVLAVILQFISGVATAIVPWFWLYCVLRFLTAIATGGTMSTSFVLVMEIIGVKWRELISVLFHIPFNLGHLTLPVFAYYIRNWHYLQFALSIPSVVLISYYWLLPESPRWLFVVGRVDEAAVVVERAAKVNRLPTERIKVDLRAYKKSLTTTTAPNGSSSKGSIWSLFATPNMRMKTLVMWFSWFVSGLTFFGVCEYVGKIGGNIFANVAMSACLEVPGTLICIYTMRRFGRKRTAVYSNLFTGIAMLTIAFLPADTSEVSLVCASCGIIGQTLAFPCLYLYASEIFPTVVRNIGVGSASMVARVGTMLAPFVAGLALTSPMMPPLIFGIFPICGAAIVLLLPETLGMPLPETLEDGENFGKKI